MPLTPMLKIWSGPGRIGTAIQDVFSNAGHGRERRYERWVELAS